MANPKVEEEQRRKRPATIVPPHHGAAAAPARQPFEGREAALDRLNRRGPSLGDVARFAGNVVKPLAPATALTAAAATPVAGALDSVRGAIAGAQGHELVDPNFLRNRVATVRDAAFDATFDPLTRGARALVGAIPIGETRAASPTPPAPSTAVAPSGSAGSSAKAQTPKKNGAPAGSAGAVAPATVGAAATPGQLYRTGNSFTDQPGGQAVDLSKSRGGFFGSISGPTFADNTRGFLEQREREREANLATQQRTAEASIQNARRMEARNLIENDRRVNRERSGGGGRRRGSRGGDERLDQLLAVTMGAPDERARPTLGEITARDAKTQEARANARLAESRSATEQAAIEAEVAKQARIGDLIGKLSPEQQVFALTGNDPRTARPTFQIATNEEADPLNPGATLKTSYLIDGSGNVRPVAAPAAPAVPQAAINKLKSDPKLAKDFDAKYGAGASARYLG